MRTIAVVLLLTACSDDGGTAVDATPVVDIDNGMCGADLRFTGELVDADSTMASFCGVNAARVEGGSATSNTAPNGRFDLCIPKGGATNLTVTPSATASGCTSMPGTYMMPAIAVGSTATIQAGAF